MLYCTCIHFRCCIDSIFAPGVIGCAQLGVREHLIRLSDALVIGRVDMAVVRMRVEMVNVRVRMVRERVDMVRVIVDNIHMV